jgi:hypothetical protein
VNECKYTRAHIYTYIHTYIHTYTCTLQISSKGQVNWNATWSVSQDLPVHYVGGAGAADHYAHILGRAGAADYADPSGTAAASSSLLCKGRPVDLGIVIDNKALDDEMLVRYHQSFGMGNVYHMASNHPNEGTSQVGRIVPGPESFCMGRWKLYEVHKNVYLGGQYHACVIGHEHRRTFMCVFVYVYMYRPILERERERA